MLSNIIEHMNFLIYLFVQVFKAFPRKEVESRLGTRLESEEEQAQDAGGDANVDVVNNDAEGVDYGDQKVDA
jgi:hypothetical protein